MLTRLLESGQDFDHVTALRLRMTVSALSPVQVRAASGSLAVLACSVHPRP